MRMQSTVTLYGLELKGESQFDGRTFPAAAIFHLDAQIAERANGKTFGVVTRPHRLPIEMGQAFEHLGNSLPIQCEAVFDAVASQTGVQLQLADIKPLSKAKAA